ncbi:MAG: transporter substrate-binding domain-containing protein [Alphaproteobacteria bacterium]|nr:transporter substrate-binding domain-containing protein [Alphaproteobacteria bacterium]
MKAPGTIVLAALVAAVAGWAAASFTQQPGESAAAAQSATPVYDRVMAAGKIRCGYAHWEPSNIVAPDGSGQSGTGYDLMEEIGRRLSLQIEWAQEVGWGTAVEDVASGKYDAVCTLMWPNSGRARRVDFSAPVNYSKISVFVRADDNRFSENLGMLNDPAYTVSYVDGTTPQVIVRSHFPQAKVVSFPELTATSENAVAVAAGKADFMVWDLYNGSMFIKNNPGSIKPLSKAVLYFANAFLLPADPRFNAMIDHAIREIVADGTFDRILDKYGVREYFSPLAKPYND